MTTQANPGVRVKTYRADTMPNHCPLHANPMTSNDEELDSEAQFQSHYRETFIAYFNSCWIRVPATIPQSLSAREDAWSFYRKLLLEKASTALPYRIQEPSLRIYSLLLLRQSTAYAPKRATSSQLTRCHRRARYFGSRKTKEWNQPNVPT